MIKYSYIYKIVFMAFAVFFSCVVSSQEESRTNNEVKSLTVDFKTGDYLCANSNGTSTFTATFEVTNFPDATSFNLEMSDANGSFTNPKVLTTIPKANAFPFIKNKVDFQLPLNTAGDAYKLRLKSDNPVVYGGETQSFAAYNVGSSAANSLEINGGASQIVLCAGGAVELQVKEIDPNFKYNWYKFNASGTSEQLLAEKTGSSYEVDEPGTYFARIFAGPCSSQNANLQSNAVEVVIPSGGSTLEINGGKSFVELCSDDEYTLKASIKENFYTYKWYKDGELLDLPAYTPEYKLPKNDRFGSYYLEVSNTGSSCGDLKSKSIKVSPKGGDGFKVETVGELIRVRYENETISLSVTHTGSDSATYQWYKDGQPVKFGTRVKLNVFEPGEYYLEVTDDLGGCSVVQKSDAYIILDVAGFKPVIEVDGGYEECNVSETTLRMVSVKAVATDGKEYELSEEQLKFLAFQWQKDNQDVLGAEEREYVVSSYENSGVYKLKVSKFQAEGFSEEISVVLSLGEIEVNSTSLSNTLCTGTVITLSIEVIDGFVYKWYKDGVELAVVDPSSLEVSEVGVYKLTYNGFGCQNEVEVDVRPFDDEVVTINGFSNTVTVVLKEGESVEVTAGGADTFEWYDTDDNLLSSTEIVELNELGEYKLVAKVGECTVEKVFEVVLDDGKIAVPNIISPLNTDGIHDTWQLPNRFAYNQNVSVIIYDTTGKELLNTANYQNDWPADNKIVGGMFFYYRIIKDDVIIKSGTLSVLE